MDVIKLLKDFEQEILSQTKRMDFNVDPKWKKDIPEKAGVYVFFENNEIVYIGETKSLRARMGDVRRTVNHTLRRKIGTQLFSQIKGFQEATSKKKFPDHIEKSIDEYMNKLNVTIFPIPFGRSEVEEFLINKYEPRFNSKSKRGNA